MAAKPMWRLEDYRNWLRMQARQLQLDPRLQRRFDLSDLVQETMLRAHQHLDGFRGVTEAEMVKWLHEILVNVLTDEIRRAKAQKRDVRVEHSLQAVVADSSARLEACLATPESSPSQKAERRELLQGLAAAVEQLPDDQRDVVVQRDLLGLPVHTIAEQLGKTDKAVAGLLLRGRRKLRELLDEYS